MIAPFLAYDQAMRYLAVITMLVLALVLVQPVAAQSFKPDHDAGWKAFVQRDYATALRHIRPLAEQGHAYAQYRLGYMYEEELGVAQDYEEAVRWYRKAADQGDASAQHTVGLMYHGGYGVPRDNKEAVRWYRLAANQGQANAQSDLGYMYANGKGVRQDHVMAYVWYSVAAANGHHPATHRLPKALAKLNASERKLALKLSAQCFEKPAKCPEYSDD